MNQVEYLVRGSFQTSSSDAAQEPLSVLWVADGRQEEALERAVERAQGLEVTRTTSERAEELVRTDSSIQAVWVSSLGLDVPVKEFLGRMTAVARRRPVLLLMGWDRGLDRIPPGVDVILCHGGITGFRLTHATHHARHRLALVKNSDAAHVPGPRLSHRTTTMASVPKKSRGDATLREALPTTFEELVMDYMGALDHAIRGSQPSSETAITDGLQKLAIHLGHLEAEPKDVVQVHSTAMIRKFDQSCAEESRRAMEVGNRLVLELMGHLTSYYRKHGLAKSAEEAPSVPRSAS